MTWEPLVDDPEWRTTDWIPAAAYRTRLLVFHMDRQEISDMYRLRVLFRPLCLILVDQESVSREFLEQTATQFLDQLVEEVY